jgi:hypothetical protein
MDFVTISLRRPTSDKAWGFVLVGGRDKEMPVFVHKITRNGIAHKAGLEPGDVVYAICQTDITAFTHNQMKAEILRAGNELDFTVRKHEINIAQFNASRGPQQAASNPAANGTARSEIVEEHVWRHGGPTFKNVIPKSYKILEQQLPQAEAGFSKMGSVMDRNLDERSPYLNATERTIQRSYGESDY